MTEKTLTKRKIVLKPKNYMCFLVLGVLLVLFAVLYYTGNMKRSSARLLHQIAYSIILAVSLNLVVGFLGELSLGHAGFMYVGAIIGCYVGSLLGKFIPVPLVTLILSLVIGGAVAALFGLIIGLPALRLKGDYLAIVTLAFGEIIRTVLSSQPLEKAFGGPQGLSVKTYSDSLFVVSFVVLIFMLFIVQNFIRSKHGRAITAIRDNEIAARASGINVTYYNLLVFVVAAFFAGVAGVLYGHGVTPIKSGAFSYNYSIQMLVMVVLGGLGSLNGSIVAAAALTYLDVELSLVLPSNLSAMRNIIYALILISIVIVNNAPALKKFRDRFSFKTLGSFLSAGLRKLIARIRKKNPERPEEEIVDDPADWSEIPTKIEMNEILSVDLRRESEEPTDLGAEDK